jgi:hypothetical protein
MEGRVTLSLNDYNTLKDELWNSRQRVLEATNLINSLKIFEISIDFEGKPELRFAPDAKRFLVRAFAPFENEYVLKDMKELSCWNISKKIEGQEVKT